MKVTMPKNYKEWMTLADVERAKMVIAFEKTEDDMSIADWARYAGIEAMKGEDDHFDDVITASAEIAMNNRVWDVYGEGTGCADVLVKALVKTMLGYAEVEAYLSDIWQSGAVEYKDKMFVRRFVAK